MFEVRGVVHPRRQDDHRGVTHLLGRGATKGGEQALGVLVHRMNPLIRKERTEALGHGPTVLDHVGDTRGDAQVILEDPEVTFLVSNEVDPRDGDPRRMRGHDADRLATKVQARGDQASRDEPVVETDTVLVDVAQECFEREHALADAAGEHVPLDRADNPRYEVQGERTFLAVVSEGYPSFAESSAQLVKARLQFTLAVASDFVYHAAVDCPWLARCAEDLVPREFGIDVQVRRPHT